MPSQNLEQFAASLEILVPKFQAEFEALIKERDAEVEVAVRAFNEEQQASLQAAIGTLTNASQTAVAEAKDRIFETVKAEYATRMSAFLERANAALKEIIYIEPTPTPAPEPVDPPPTDPDPQPVDPVGSEPETPADPKVFRVVGLSDPMPETDGSNAKVVNVPTGYQIVVWAGTGTPTRTTNTPSKLLPTSKLSTPEDGSIVGFQDSHSTGQAVLFPKDAVLFLRDVQFYPTIILPPPTTNPNPNPTTPDPVLTTPPPDKPNRDFADPVLVGDLAVVLKLADGSTLRFDGSDPTAQTHDIIEVPFAAIQQRNVQVTSVDKLWNVYFRPDVNNGRVEFIVKYGDPNNGDAKTQPAYTAELYHANQLLEAVQVPKHFIHARYRWESSRRPRVRTPSELVQLKLVPNYARGPLTTIKLPRLVKPYALMGASSIAVFMGMTGERDDIGLEPEVTSAYLATGDDGAFWSMMQWAEASASGPWHIDNLDNDGGILNLDRYPTVTVYGLQYSKPPLHIQPVDTAYPDLIRPESAHQPMLGYIPFLTTGDPFYAEEIQYQTNYYLAGEHNSSGNKSYVFGIAQTRSFAWMLRSVALAYLSSKLIDHKGIRPASFWKKVLDANRDYLLRDYVHNESDPLTAVFASGPSKQAMGWWQEDYFAGVLAMCVCLGLEDWEPIRKWKFRSNIARLNGTSGWDPLNPTVYYAQQIDGKAEYAKENIGNGTIGPITQTDRASLLYTSFTIKFGSETTFTVTRPGGSEYPGKGEVGVPYLGQYGPTYTITQGNVPFSKGDQIVLTTFQPTSWGELLQINLRTGTVKPSPDGLLQTPTLSYVGTLLGAMNLAAPFDPEVAKMRDVLALEMSRAATVNYVSWRNSFA